MKLLADTTCRLLIHAMIPSTMKAAVATGFGGIEENIGIRDDWPTPQLDPEDTEHLLVHVLACALAPGDVRVLSGKTAYVQLPDGPPYVIGSDVSGIVVQAPLSSRFRVGDYVVSRFDEPKPSGGVAEYRKVLVKLTEKCPQSISPIDACGLPASAMAAKRVVTDFVKKGDRVLVIGGSGGVGSCVLQYVKLKEAAFVAAVSTQTDHCKRYGANQVIDYREQNWWEMTDFEKDKFDVVIDLVNGDNWTVGAQTGRAICRKGTYVALLMGVRTEVEAYGPLSIIPILCTLMGRMLWSRLNPWIPRWVVPEALRLEDGDLKELFEDVVAGRLKPVVDTSFDFNNDGVHKAMALQKSIHAHGKVVIKIAEK